MPRLNRTAGMHVICGKHLAQCLAYIGTLMNSGDFECCFDPRVFQSPLWDFVVIQVMSENAQLDGTRNS